MEPFNPPHLFIGPSRRTTPLIPTGSAVPNPRATNVAPPGWSKTVEKMKSHTEISNPFALAWWMKKQGDTPHK